MFLLSPRLLRVVVALATAQAVVGASTTFYNDASVPVKWSIHYDLRGGASAIFEKGVDEQLVDPGENRIAKYTTFVSTVKLTAVAMEDDSVARGWEYDGNYDVVARDNEVSGVDIYMRRQNKDRADVDALIALGITIYSAGLDPLDDGDDQNCEGPEDSAIATVNKGEHRMMAYQMPIGAFAPDFPGSGIYYAKPKKNNLLGRRCANCNAFAIDATHIMTAAHCVFSSGSYTFEGASVKLGKVGKKNKGTEVYVKKCLVPEPYKADTKVADYAVCLVDDIGDIPPWEVATLNQVDQNSNYNLLTYPLSKEACFQDNPEFKKTPWKASCPLLSSGNSNVLYLNCMTFPGDSGAAMYNNNNQVIAVMKGGSMGFIFTTAVRATIAAFVENLK